MRHILKYGILVRKSEGKRPLGRPRRRWTDTVTRELKELEYEGVDWIHLGQGSGQWQDIVTMLMNLRVPDCAGNFLTR
jgi:hypothetical protein